MNDTSSHAADLDGAGEVEFFGVKLRVNNPRLAALLDGDGTDEVTVVVGSAGAGHEASEADLAADARGEGVDRLEQAITSEGVADVQVRRADVDAPPERDSPPAATVERPA
jgi:hypothetical protein